MYEACSNFHICLFIFYICSYGNCICIVSVPHVSAVFMLPIAFLTCFVSTCRTTVLLDLKNEYVCMHVCMCVFITCLRQ
jgi:hypothetical protein